MMSARVLTTAALGLALVASTAEAQTRTRAQRDQDRQMAAVPRCETPMGSITFAEGENHDFDNLNLQPPQALLRVVVQRSGCFTIVDRTAASQNAIERERRLAQSGELQRNSNIGGGQVRVADFIMLTEVTAANENASGSRFGGTARFAGRGIAAMATGGMSEMLPLAANRLSNIGPNGQQPQQQQQQTTVSGGLTSQTSEVNTVISIVNLRTTETVVASEGYAAKRDINWNLSASAAFGGFVGGGYENTEVGRIVGQSLVNAYAKAVGDMRNVDLAALMPSAAPEAQPLVQPVVQPVSQPSVREADSEYDEAPRPRRASTNRRPRRQDEQAEVLRTAVLREEPGGRAMGTLSAGTTVTLTGEIDDGWKEVIDDDGNVGWVQDDRLIDLD